MTNFRISLVAGIVAVTIVSIVYFLAFEEEKKMWTIGGGEKGGNYDAVARALADYLQKAEGWEVKARESSGSGENLQLLREGKVDLCLVQNDFPGDEKARALASLYDESLHVIVREGNTSLSNFPGGTISVGQAGGGTEALARAMLAQLGVSQESVKWRHESLQAGLDGLRSGKSSAVCVVTGIGNAVVAEALSKGDLSLLPLGEVPGASLAYDYPFVETTTIPPKVYATAPGKGLPARSLPTVGTRVVLACQVELNDADALALTRTVIEGRAALTRKHPLLARLAPPNDSTDLQFPLHEGARQYYERDEPGFVQHWSEPIALLFSVLAVAWGIGVALRGFILNQRKDTLDVYFERVDELTTELVKGLTADRATEIAMDLHAIRRETTRKLVAEELAANESFVIFQRELHTAQQMVNESLRKPRKDPTQQKGISS